IYMDDFSSDNVNVSGLDELVAGLRIVPADAASAGWTWAQLYNINYFLEQYDKPIIPEQASDHSGGMARFFMAYLYFEKAKRFGDVPRFSQSSHAGSPGLLTGRDSREVIIDSITAHLNFATNNTRPG